MTYFLKALDLLWCAWSLNDEKIGLRVQGLTECLMNVREWLAQWVSGQLQPCIEVSSQLHTRHPILQSMFVRFLVAVGGHEGLHGWLKFDISLRVCNAACCGRFCPKFAQALAWLGPWSDYLHLLFAHYLVGTDESTLPIDLHPCHQLCVGFYYHSTAHNGTVMSSAPWSPKQLLASNALGLWDVFFPCFSLEFDMLFSAVSLNHIHLYILLYIKPIYV